MLPEVLQETARQFGDRAAYVSADGEHCSYAQLNQLADETAAGLATRGVNEGSVVALLLPSTIDYLVCYGAVAKLGAISAGINPRYTVAEQQAVLGVTEPTHLICTTEVADSFTLAATTVVLVITPAASVANIAENLRIAGESPAPLADDPERPVAICFTSGSTGEPKGALFTNRQLSAIRELDTGGAWGGGGNAVAPTEFAHVGFMTKWPWLLAGGGTTHLQHSWRASRVLELLHQYRMPVVAGVAPQIALLLAQPEFDSYDFSAVTTIVAGAAASPPALVHEARRRFGATYLIRYSSTESGGVGFSTAPDADDHEALHTIGRPRPGVEAEVRDDTGKPLAEGEIGELWMKSPTSMARYWNDPTETRATLVDGWLRTGDLAVVEPSGLFRLAGRVKEMFIRGGYNVYPMEVEAALGTHPLVRDVIVVPQPDAVMGEVGVAAVVPLDPQHPPTLEALREHASASLAAYKLPAAIAIVGSYPRNANQKVDRRALEVIVAEHLSG